MNFVSDWVSILEGYLQTRGFLNKCRKSFPYFSHFSPCQEWQLCHMAYCRYPILIEVRLQSLQYVFVNVYKNSFNSFRTRNDVNILVVTNLFADEQMSEMCTKMALDP